MKKYIYRFLFRLFSVRIVTRKRAIATLDHLTNEDGARLTIRQYNKVLTNLGFKLQDDLEQIHTLFEP